MGKGLLCKDAAALVDIAWDGVDVVRCLPTHRPRVGSRRHACGETAGRFETKAAQHTLAKTAKPGSEAGAMFSN